MSPIDGADEVPERQYICRVTADVERDEDGGRIGSDEKRHYTGVVVVLSTEVTGDRVVIFRKNAKV